MRSAVRFVTLAVVLALSCATGAYAEHSYTPNNRISSDAPTRFEAAEAPALDEEAWQRLSSKHRYGEIEASEKPDEPGFGKKEPRFSGFDVNSRLISTIVLSVVVLVLLVLIVYLVVRRIDDHEGKLVSLDDTAYRLEDLEAGMPESDLERFLREARNMGDFRAVVRIYFLIALHRLNEQGLIKWERDKTNLTFLEELSQTSHADEFSALTRTYELIWYGEAPIDQQRFERIAPRFDAFLEILRREQ